MDVCYADYGLTRGEDEEMVKRYNTLAEIREALSWAVETVLGLIQRGAIWGSGKKDADGNPADMDLSEDMIRTMKNNRRAGAYEE